MTMRAERAVEKIMGRAFERAARVLDSELRGLLAASPTQYSRFVLAVGWGPSLFREDGTLAKEEHLTTRAAAVMAFANRFYDAYGADNREVT